MATARDIRVRGYCDRMHEELSGMKARLLGLIREVEFMTGPDAKELKGHIPHFQDIVRTIDWKLEILTKVCPFDWTAYGGETESVQVSGETSGRDFVAGGYIGG